MNAAKKVLVVDDEPDIRELLALTLERMSLQSVTAPDISTAKDLLASQNFDLCLTDMQLPDGNGIDLVARIQRDSPQMPVAVITAHGSMDSAVRALKAGAFDFVAKPVRLDDLRNLIQAAMRLTVSNDDTQAPSEDTNDNPTLKTQLLGSSNAFKRDSGIGREACAQPGAGIHQRRIGHRQGVGCPPNPRTGPATGQALYRR